MVNKPFILGSNLVTSDLDLCDYETFMRTVAGNTGNIYISYALIREICGRYRNVPQIKSLYAYDFSQMDRDFDMRPSENSCVGTGSSLSSRRRRNLRTDSQHCRFPWGLMTAGRSPRYRLGKWMVKKGRRLMGAGL